MEHEAEHGDSQQGSDALGPRLHREQYGCDQDGVEEDAGLIGGEVESSAWLEAMITIAPTIIPVRLPVPPRITTA